MFEQGRILSRPFGIEWCGWRSDTYTLQQCGWQLAVNFEPERMRYQLLMKNTNLRLCAVTNTHELDFILSSANHHDMRGMPVFRVEHIAPQIQVVRMAMSNEVSCFEEIDARPQYVESKVENLYDLNVFATKQAEQVLIDKADMTVVEHLEAIKALQSPKQKEIRQRMLRDEGRPRQQTPRLHLVAQLVHYAEAA